MRRAATCFPCKTFLSSGPGEKLRRRSRSPNACAVVTEQWIWLVRYVVLLLLFFLHYLSPDLASGEEPVAGGSSRAAQASARRHWREAARELGDGSPRGQLARRRSAIIELEHELSATNSEVERVVRMKRHLADKVKTRTSGGEPARAPLDQREEESLMPSRRSRLTGLAESGDSAGLTRRGRSHDRFTASDRKRTAACSPSRSLLCDDVAAGIGERGAPRISPAYDDAGVARGRRAGSGGEDADESVWRRRRPRQLLEQVMLAREKTGRNFDALQKADPAAAREIRPRRASANHRHGAGAPGRQGGVLAARVAAGKAARSNGEAAGAKCSSFRRKWRRRFHWSCTAK